MINNKKAFTLIELLVIIVIIGILASLIFPVLTNAKLKSESAACINNLKQISLAANIYESDYSAYPIYLTYSNNQPVNSVYWFERMSFYLQNMSIFSCPNNKYWKILGMGYGYNSSGCWGFGETGRQLGLGGVYKESFNQYLDNDEILPTKSSMIKSPVDLISFGDSTIHSDLLVINNQVVTGENAYCSKDLSSGLFWNRYYFIPSSTSPTWEIKSKNLMIKRHFNRVNISFLDGHVEKFNQKIFEVSNDNLLRKWNIDNEPHSEAFYPSLRF